MIFTNGIYGAPGAQAPDRRIWAVSQTYNNWGIFYNEGTPDFIEFRTGGSTTAKIALDSGVIYSATHYPNSSNAHDLGSTSLRWRNVYTQDLQLSNEAKKDEGGNDVDGTWGDWTLQEGESDVYMINNRSGKKFRIKMEEVS